MNYWAQLAGLLIGGGMAGWLAYRMGWADGRAITAPAVPRSVLWPAWFAVVDCETTALDPKLGSLVSIGAVHPLSGETFYGRCRVREGALIDSKAMEVNGADWLEDKALPPETELVAKFARWMHRHGVRLVGGKNPTFDVRWLEAAWARGEFPVKFPITHRTLDLHSLVLAWALVHRPAALLAEGFKTDDLYPLLGLPQEPKPHHALTGATMEAQAFRVILEKGGML